MVKADAYGLGAVRVARTLERVDPWGFGVATIAEGEELRRAASRGRSSSSRRCSPATSTRRFARDLTPTLGDRDAIDAGS